MAYERKIQIPNIFPLQCFICWKRSRFITSVVSIIIWIVSQYKSHCNMSFVTQGSTVWQRRSLFVRNLAFKSFWKLISFVYDITDFICDAFGLHYAYYRTTLHITRSRFEPRWTFMWSVWRAIWSLYTSPSAAAVSMAPDSPGHVPFSTMLMLMIMSLCLWDAKG